MHLDKPCLPYTGYIMPNGYGQQRVDGKLWLAHRWAAHCSLGSCPPGQVVRHKCDNRACREPTHLEYGSQGDNLNDRKERYVYRKLTRQDAENIKLLLAAGEKGTVLAEWFGVTPTMICHIKKGRQWA